MVSCPPSSPKPHPCPGEDSAGDGPDQEAFRIGENDPKGSPHIMGQGEDLIGVAAPTLCIVVKVNEEDEEADPEQRKCEGEEESLGPGAPPCPGQEVGEEKGRPHRGCEGGEVEPQAPNKACNDSGPLQA